MDGDQQQALAIYTQLLESWNRRDADAFASFFDEHGNAVGFDGSQMNGRGEIAATLRDVFAHHQTASYVAKLREIRSLAPGVVLLRAVVGMIPPGTTELNPATNAVQSLVVMTGSGGARLALLHNTPAALHGRPDLAEQLTTELAAVVHRGVVVATA